MRAVGREVSQVGSAFTLLGASITAPLLLAYNNSAKYSAGITAQINEMKDQYEDLQVSIGEALLPTMRQFNDILENLISRWNSLNPVQQQHIVQTVFMVGQWILFGGIATKVLGVVIKTVADVVLLFSKFILFLDMVVAGFLKLLLFNPGLLAIYVSIGLIVGAMIKWKEFGDYVFDVLQKIGDVISIIVRTMMAGFEAIRGNLSGAREQIAKIKADWADLTSATPGQHGSFAGAFDNMKVSISNAMGGLGNFKDSLMDIKGLFSGLAGGGTGATGINRKGDIFEGFKKGIQDAKDNLKDFFTMGAKAGVDWTNAMKGTFSSFFDDAFNGQLKKGTDYFRAFGQQILKIFSNMLAQMVTSWITSGVASMLSGGGGGGFSWLKSGLSLIGAVGGIGGLSGGGLSGGLSSAGLGSGLGGINSIPALPSFDVGTPYVPRDMVANIHQGERILTAEENRNGGGGGVTITIAPMIQAWDASDIMRNRKTITDAIAADIMSNGTLREVIKRYGN